MFNIEQLIENQNKHIASILVSDTIIENYPFPITEHSFDDFIVEAFSNFPIEETSNLRISTITGPTAMIEGAPCVSRPSKIRAKFLGPDKAKAYAQCIADIILADTSLVSIGPDVTYCFGMWIPIYYLLPTSNDHRIVTHYAKRVIADPLYPLKTLISNAQTLYT